MAIGDLVSRFLGPGSGLDVTVYECAGCESTFESAKQPERASCPECLSSSVAPVDSADASR